MACQNLSSGGAVVVSILKFDEFVISLSPGRDLSRTARPRSIRIMLRNSQPYHELYFSKIMPQPGAAASQSARLDTSVGFVDVGFRIPGGDIFMMKRTLSVIFTAALLLSVSGYTECYKPTGRGDGLPKHIKTLAIPPFQHPSLRYKVEQRFTSAVVDEAVHRARSLKIVSNPEGADAVMIGAIKYFSFAPKLLDDFGRARLFEITIYVAV